MSNKTKKKLMHIPSVAQLLARLSKRHGSHGRGLHKCDVIIFLSNLINFTFGKRVWGLHGPYPGDCENPPL